MLRFLLLDDSAEDDVDSELKADPKASDVHQLMAEITEVCYGKAVDMLEEALRLDSGPLALTSILTLHCTKSAFTKGLSFCTLKILALDRRMHEAHLILLNIYAQQWRYEDALQQVSLYRVANWNTPQRNQIKALSIQIENALSQEKQERTLSPISLNK